MHKFPDFCSKFINWLWSLKQKFEHIWTIKIINKRIEYNLKRFICKINTLKVYYYVLIGFIALYLSRFQNNPHTNWNSKIGKFNIGKYLYFSPICVLEVKLPFYVKENRPVIQYVRFLTQHHFALIYYRLDSHNPDISLFESRGIFSWKCHCKINYPLRAGFEPAREDPIGFRVQRLNLSAITARYVTK